MVDKLEYNQEERLLAAIYHASVIAGGVNIVVGLVVHVNQKEKSTCTGADIRYDGFGRMLKGFVREWD